MFTRMNLTACRGNLQKRRTGSVTSNVPPAGRRLHLEPLEQRRLLSTISWANSDGGDFIEPDNWLALPLVPPRVPGPADTAVFDLSQASYTVSFPDPRPVLDEYINDKLRIGDNAVTFELLGRQYRLLRENDVTVAVGLAVGETARLTIRDGELSAGGQFVVDGSGTVTLDGGILTAASIELAGGRLEGNGTVQGPLFAQSGSHVAPGLSTGILNTADVTFDAGSHLDVELSGDTPGAEHDQLVVLGAVEIAGAELNVSVEHGAEFVESDIVIIDNDGPDPVSGTFAHLAEGDLLADGDVLFRISYVGGDGNDVALTTLSGPEANLQEGILFVGGTAGDDQIDVHPDGEVTVNGESLGTFPRATRIRVYGLSGNDRIRIDPMLVLPAELYGGWGDDTIDSGPGDDVLQGGPGDDVLQGGEGDDTIDAGPGNDLLQGGAGNDVLQGGPDADTIDAGPGNDVIQHGFEADTIDSGLGDDTILLVAENIEAALHAEIHDAQGNDVLDLSGIGAGVRVDLRLDSGQLQTLVSAAPAPIRQMRASAGDVSLAIYGTIEHVIGTVFDDWLAGNGADNVLDGVRGSDQLSGRGGNDHYWLEFDGSDELTERLGDTVQVTMPFPGVVWAEIDWGDGTIEPAVVDSDAGTVWGSHDYASVGVYAVSVFVTDAAGTHTETLTVAIRLILPEVIGRNVFYNNSAFDGNNPDPNEDDGLAIAAGKVALLPGETASFVNYTNYFRGVNGIMIDVADLPPTVDPLDPDDYFGFRVGNEDDLTGWSDVSTPADLTVWAGGSTSDSDRLTVIWPDNTVENTWLEVTVWANEKTGLIEPDVFYFGNLIGETGNSVLDAKVDALDILDTRNNPRPFFDPPTIDTVHDFNRDKRVNAIDTLIARNNQTWSGTELELIDLAAQAVAVNSEAKSAGQARPLNGELERADWLYDFSPEDVSEKPGRLAPRAIDRLWALLGQ